MFRFEPRIKRYRQESGDSEYLPTYIRDTNTVKQGQQFRGIAISGPRI